MKIDLFQAGSWHDITDTIIKDPILIIDLFLRMFYLSVSTATLCGKRPLTSTCFY